MKNKPGFKVKMDNEKLLYLVICIVIGLFVVFLPQIYRFVSDIKTGNLFQNNNIKDDNEDAVNQNDEGKIIEPTGDTSLTCTKTDSNAEGDSTETLIFYYENNGLVNLKKEIKYDAIADSFLNYVYSEKAKYDSLYNLYKDISGFSYTSVSESRSLSAIFIYDLTKLNLELLKSDDENLSIELKVKKGDSLDDTKNLYTNLEYSCK